MARAPDARERIDGGAARIGACSHTRAVESMEPVASTVACGSKVRHTISAVWPARVARHLPSLVSHSLAVLSKLPVAMRSPNGLLNARQYTMF